MQLKSVFSIEQARRVAQQPLPQAEQQVTQPGTISLTYVTVYNKINALSFAGLRTPVEHVDNVLIGNLTVQRQPDFTGSGGAETCLAPAQLVSQICQGRAIEFGMTESLISCKSATLNLLRPDNLIGTLLR